MERNTYFDFLRGIAIIMVVGIHTAAIPDNLNIGMCSIVFRELLNFSVPLFLTISGLFIIRSYKSKGYKLLLSRQIKKIYIPAVIWMIPLMIYNIYKGANCGLQLLRLFTCDYCYFVALIIQMYLILPLLKKIDKSGLLICAVITIVSVIFYNYLFSLFLSSVAFLFYWVLFFAIGVYYSDRERNYKLYLPFFLILIGSVLQIIEAKYLVSIGVIGIGVKASSWVYASGMVLLLLSSKFEIFYNSIRNCYLVRYIRYIGDISFGIYLIHVYFMYLTYSLPLIWVVKWVLVLVLTIITIVLLKKTIPQRWWIIFALNR